MKNKTIKLRCAWYHCGRFISKKTGRATIKEPNIIYCLGCYKKGEEMEEDAMGLQEQCDEINWERENNLTK